MATTHPFLKRIHNVDQAPPQSYVLYCMPDPQRDISAGITYVLKSDYENFARQFINQTSLPVPLTMDLNFAQVHAIVLDVDAKTNRIPNSTWNPNVVISTLVSILRSVLIPHIDNFTIVFAIRPQGYGIHVHLPEFLICNDDYEKICSELAPRFDFSVDTVTYALDVPTNWCLTNAYKPGKPPYRPYCVAFVEERNNEPLYLNLNSLHEFNRSYELAVASFARRKRKANTQSYFRNLLLFRHESELRRHVLGITMPIPILFRPLYKLSYPTIINDAEPSDDMEVIASFAYQLADNTLTVKKGKQFRTDGSHWLKSYYHLKFNAFIMTDFDTGNRALKTWYQRIKATVVPDEAPSRFHALNTLLKQENYKFYDDPNPIKTIIEYNDGYYFLPVCYALSRHLSLKPDELVQLLRAMVAPSFGDLLDRIEIIPDQHWQVITATVTHETIIYCGHHLYPTPKNMKEKITSVLHQMMRQLLTAINSTDAMIELLRHIQKTHFPDLVARLTNSTKKPVHLMWNFFEEAWIEITQKNEINQLMQNLWNNTQTFIRNNATLVGGDIKHLEKLININNLVQSILSDSNMERRSIAMDRQLWLLRISESATIDLLTKHVGGTVPEFYISERRLGLDHVDRLTFIRLSSANCSLDHLYQLLFSKPFFRSYLKACLTDTTDDLVDTLRELTYTSLPPVDDQAATAEAESMLQAYVHLCKYMSFDYEVILYMLDLLASVLVSTNYERKFIVFKGDTCNGKSKFFQILQRVFGGYLSIIRADNLRPSGNAGMGPSPEFASTLFCCRAVLFDEIGGKLNENLIKEITGNSTVTFRNLYEQTQGGVPMAKIFASTNRNPDVTATQAFQDRVVAIPFHATFTHTASDKTSQQLMDNKYPMSQDEGTVEGSYVGFWKLMWFHFLHNVDPKDGRVHYRPMPTMLVEFKKEFLSNTDVYQQFKIVLDVQQVPNTITTAHDLKSAVRQFIHGNKDKSIQESELKERFDEEFSHLKKSDISLGSYQSTLLRDVVGPLLDEEDEEEQEEQEPESKRVKLDEGFVYYYENVVIKNLKRTSLNE